MARPASESATQENHMRLIQRENELAILGDLIAACYRGHGQIALISGAVGTGKTALLHAVEERVTELGSIYLNAVATRAESRIPMGVLKQVFRCGALPSATAERATRTLSDHALIARLHGFEPEPTADIMAHVFEASHHLLADLAGHHMITISVDDVQYADALSLHFLLYLMRRVKSARILILLSECADLLPPSQLLHTDVFCQPNFRLIQLHPLPRSGVVALLAAYLDVSAARRLAGACHAVTGGIPLLVKALAQDYCATANCQSTELVFGRAFSLALMAFLHSCEPVVMQLAQAAAVLGDPAPAALLAELLDITVDSAAHGVSVLSAAGLMKAGRLRCHAVLEAILGAMPPDDRAALNRRAAHVLQSHGATANTVARHLLAADRIDLHEAARLFQEAAEQALADDEIDLAISYLRRAHEVCSEPERLAAIKFMLTRAEWRLNPANAARHLPELVTAVREGTLGNRHATALIPYLLWQGRSGDAAEVLAVLEPPAGGALATSPSVPLVASAAAQAVDFRAGQLDTSYPGLTGHVQPGQPARTSVTPTSAGMPRAFKEASILAWARTGEDQEQTILVAEQILEGSRLDDPTLIPIVASLAGLMCTNQLDRAAIWCQRLLDDATDRGVPTWQAVLRAAFAVVEVRRGGLAAAQTHAGAALSLLSPKAWGMPIGAPLAAMLLAATEAGKHHEAASYLRIPIPDQMFQTPCGLMYLHARGGHYLSTSRPHAALEDFQSCGERMITWGLDLPAFLPWRTDAAQAHLKIGQDAEARKLANEQIALLDSGNHRLRGISLRVLAMTTQPRQRLALLSESVDLLRESGARIELGHAFADLSRAHHALGEHSRACMASRWAHRLADQCGAEPLKRAMAAQLDDMAAHHWEHPTRLAQLSAAERRVAALAAHGYTNRQIAGKLYVTVSTVEQHLTRVYRKLGVSRRADLPTELQHRASCESSGLA